jgi:hypothetical protein
MRRLVTFTPPSEMFKSSVHEEHRMKLLCVVGQSCSAPQIDTRA